MSKQVLDAKRPGCGEAVSVNVDIPDPRETIKIVTQEDTAKIGKLTTDLTEAQRSLEAVKGEVQRWQNGENHLQATDMLSLLQTCPNCKPTLDAFVSRVSAQAVAGLTPAQVKDIARSQKWWPPPIDLSGLTRKARP